MKARAIKLPTTFPIGEEKGRRSKTKNQINIFIWYVMVSATQIQLLHLIDDHRRCTRITLFMVLHR